MSSIVATVIFGFIFGFFMQFARVNRNDTITGMAVLEDFTPAKVMGLAIGVGLLLVNLLVELGLASYHVKPVMMGGLVWGGGKLFYDQPARSQHSTSR